MRMLSIASGSSGNCYYVGTEHTHLLVDAGLSGKKIEQALNGIDISGSDIDGILLTHEHIDHVKGLGILARRYGIDIYATKATIDELKNMSCIGEIDEGLFHGITADETFDIKDIRIEASSIWHDAADPVCYSMESSGKKVSIATDMGAYDGYMTEKLAGSDIMVIEANHDVRMLEAGPYPYYLKKRILGSRGHLSNEDSGRLIRSVLNNHIKAILLGHLSRENNIPELAYETVKCELMDNDYTNDVRDLGLAVAKRDIPGELITL